MSVRNWKLAETPFAVVDVETTGLLAGRDRIVEVSVVRVVPGGKPAIVFDSLIDPGRDPGPTEIHGIAAHELVGAPRFADVAAHLAGIVAGHVIAGHNAYFDLGFLRTELGAVGIDFDPPFLCTMGLRSLLGLGGRAKLHIACADEGITIDYGHVAAIDAEATGLLLAAYLRRAAEQRRERFSDLGAGSSLKFIRTWDRAPNGHPQAPAPKAKSRLARMRELAPRPYPEDYARSLVEALVDFELTSDERESLIALRQRQGLADEQIRAIHASVFGWALGTFASDAWVDDAERYDLQRVHRCLSVLGWAPGE